MIRLCIVKVGNNLEGKACHTIVLSLSIYSCRNEIRAPSPLIRQIKRAVVCDRSYPQNRQRSRLRDEGWKEWKAEQYNLMANSSSVRKGGQRLRDVDALFPYEMTSINFQNPSTGYCQWRRHKSPAKNHLLRP
jgi:hypothetical protein